MEFMLRWKRAGLAQKQPPHRNMTEIIIAPGAGNRATVLRRSKSNSTSHILVFPLFRINS